MPNINDTPPSRLSLSTAELRNAMEARNLYTPDSEYPLQSTQNSVKVVSTINTIISALTPFKSYNLEDTVYGRLIQGNANTPLAQIGIAMLGKQMALNSMSNALQQLLPEIKVTNLFDGNPETNLFTPHKDFTITKVEGQSDFKSFVQKVIGTKNPSTNPFSETSRNSDFLKNSGSGQLVFMLDQLNKNVYKSSDITLNQVAIDVKDPIQPRRNLVSTDNMTFFNFANEYEYPLMKHYPSSRAGVAADQSMINALNTSFNANKDGKSNQEYAPNQEFIENLGNTVQTYKTSSLGTQNEWLNKSAVVPLIWGVDGIDKNTAGILSEYRGTFGINEVSEDTGFESNFGVVNGGLLQYTRNLVRATEGQIGDITRKAFKKGDEIIGFNGSSLWKANDSKYAQSPKSNQAGKTGVRQHTALDPYNRFAKAIRFDGNNVYGGNINSVIYNSVMPRIHPTLNKAKDGAIVENKNLMLSIENLAIKVISKDNVGIIDDEYGSEIPACEVGPFNGRIMWFPPYAMEINETATAKYESTVMVGRNEPMYNYQNSERTATLNFTLLVDYPPNVRNYMNSDTPQKDMAEFFAFGGDEVGGSPNVTNLELQLRKLEEKKASITPNEIPDAFDTPVVPSIMRVYFPNDMPHSNEVETIFDDMYKGGYEIDTKFKNKYDARNMGLNQWLYTNKNVFDEYESEGINYYRFYPNEPNFSQYDTIDTSDAYGGSQLNAILKDFFDNKNLWDYYEINVVGHCSSPADIKYNEALGLRRAKATEQLIRSKLSTLYGIEGLNIKINTFSIGEQDAKADTDVSSIAAKENRYARINFMRNSKKYVNPNPKKELQSDIDMRNQLDKEIAAITTKINAAKLVNVNNSASCVMNERTDDDTAILHGFQSIAKNYYYPIFHSQTPEDFHKRLTFLQQCTRQGAAKDYDFVKDSNGILRARNSVFGRQPICILRVGDFFYTKVIIESVNIDYTDTTWDMNPEGFGMQPMLAKVTLNMKVIGGQSLKGPIDALQNAVSFNYYANSNFTNKGMYVLPAAMASMQSSYKAGIDVEGGNNYAASLTSADKADNAATVKKFTERNEKYKNSLK